MSAEEEVKKIESIFTAADFYEKHAHHTNELNAQMEAAKARIDALYARWQDLEEIKKGSV